MGYVFKAPTREVSRVFIHCSASNNPDHDDISVIDDWHRRRGFHGVGYHGFIQRNGTYQPGRDLERMPAAQEKHNSGTIAVCLHGLNAFAQEQFATLRDFCSQVHEQLPLVTFHGHREVNIYKTCPNFDYRAVLGLDAKGRLT